MQNDADREVNQLVEREFFDSWNKIEAFFREPMVMLEHPDVAIDFIQLLRKKGYDHYFRAGSPTSRESQRHRLWA